MSPFVLCNDPLLLLLWFTFWVFQFFLFSPWAHFSVFDRLNG